MAEKNKGERDKRGGAVSEEARETGYNLARLLIGEGHLTEKQFEYAKRVQSKLEAPRTFIAILKELEMVTDEEVRSALQKNPVSLKLGSLLLELGYIKLETLKKAFSIQSESEENLKLGEVLVNHRLIEGRKLAEILSYQLGYPYIEPSFPGIDSKLLSKIPVRILQNHNFIPVGVEDEKVVIAFADPTDDGERKAVESVFGEDYVPAIATRRAIQETLALYERGTKLSKGAPADEKSIIGIVNTLFEEALKVNASDIHIEPMRDKVRVRFRIDGVLTHIKDLNKELLPPMSSRIKVLSKSDIAERRRHQDGRIIYDELGSGLYVDMRVSFYITVFGEKIVLRILNKKSDLIDLEDLGMSPRMLERFREEALETPSGVVIITGPTGSGKTTTLYSSVNYLNVMGTSIITAEEPVEYIIDGVSQCSINPKINVTFEETLRHIVRQDPDIIVLGEIRDQFSAETAVQAALTGHKVLTTFHTEDSIGGLLRLLNMNIEAFLISSTVVSVVAQRLLRRTCSNCSESYAPTPAELRLLGYSMDELKGNPFRLGRGCPLCSFTGYKGRLGVFELLVLNEKVKDAILDRKTSHEIRRVSIESTGLVTLFEDGINRALMGDTSIQEVLRHLPRTNKPRSIKEIKKMLGR